jgi:hypothetical protein
MVGHNCQVLRNGGMGQTKRLRTATGQHGQAAGIGLIRLGKMADRVSSKLLSSGIRMALDNPVN